MAGYDHASGMSFNALAAYGAGKKPISRITRADLDHHDIEIPVAFARWLAKEGHWTPAEWHHSGGTSYNKVDFYDPAELAEQIRESDFNIAALQTAWRSSKTPPNIKTARVAGSYVRFGGSRSTPRYRGRVHFTGTLVGKWIHMDDGTRKLAAGNHIKWDYCE